MLQVRQRFKLKAKATSFKVVNAFFLFVSTEKKHQQILWFGFKRDQSVREHVGKSCYKTIEALITNEKNKRLKKALKLYLMNKN